MKKFSAVLLIAFYIIANFTEISAEQVNRAAKSDEILGLIFDTENLADITSDCALREKPSIISKSAGEIKRGLTVEIIKDKTEKWYYVKNEDFDLEGWLPADCLLIREAEQRDIPEMTKEEIEEFANLMNFPSATDFFVWTDIARQRTHILSKRNGNYELLATMVCSTGKPSSPTTSGFFTVSDRGKWFYSGRFKSGAKYWVRFNDTYLFHSLPMDKSKKVIDETLGRRVSSGCVRHSIEDAKWLYDNIPKGTSVFIH